MHEKIFEGYTRVRRFHKQPERRGILWFIEPLCPAISREPPNRSAIDELLRHDRSEVLPDVATSITRPADVTKVVRPTSIHRRIRWNARAAQRARYR